VADVVALEILKGFTVRLTFDDGAENVIDLDPFLKGPIFEPWRDPARFREIFVDKDGGTIAWPNGADICPDVLYYWPKPVPWAETDEWSRSMYPAEGGG
jgi:hypothetical protein